MKWSDVFFGGALGPSGERMSAAAPAAPVAPAKSAPAAKGGKATSGAAGGALPPPITPNVKGGEQTLPSFLRNPTPIAILPQTDSGLANIDITTLRGSGTNESIRQFIAASPDLSAAVFAYLRAAITSYTAVAKNRDGTFNPDATNLLQQIIARFDVLPDYKIGFNGVSSMNSLSESLAKECLTYGAMSLELVLDKARLPAQLVPVSVSTIKFGTDGLRRLPQQRLGAAIVDLDIPSFFYVSLDQDLKDPYARSPLESSLQPVIFAQELMNDLRRVMKKAVHPRVEVVIDVEQMKALFPADAWMDDEKRRKYMDDFITSVETKVNDLKPEDALVYFNALKIGYISAGNVSVSDEWNALVDLSNAKVATGAKSLPSILGQGTGSANIASVETMLFMKNASAIQLKLNEIYSRAFTLALRLFGQDVICEWKYDNIDLRPDMELEAFKVMKQSRILEQLSYGFIVDEEASLALTGKLPPPGMTPLSGTLFFVQTPGAATDAANANGHSNTSSGGPGGTKDQKKPATPTSAKGQKK